MKKVLIVEDEPMLVKIYESVLSQDFAVKTATSGVDGLKIIEKWQPDLVLLDLMMPDVDGRDVLRTMRSKPWGKTTKVIVLTNIGKNRSDLELDQYNIEDLILKVDLLPSELVKLVKKQLTD